MIKNVAIMIPQLYGGGAERIAGLLSKRLSQKYNVYLFLTETDNIGYDYSGQLVDLSEEGGDSVEIIRACKKRYHIDCAISFLLHMNMVNIRSKGDELVIISQHNSRGETEPYFYGTEARIKQWYNHADKIVAVSYGVEHDLVHNFGVEQDLVTTIYNFIDKKDIAQKAQEDADEETVAFAGCSKVILNVGRLVPVKNQSKLIRQFTKLVAAGYDVKLLIVGSGPLEEELRCLAAGLGVADRIRIVAYCANPFPYYKLASIMTFTSNHEGLGNVLLEAMALGLPVVAVDCLSGPRELLKGSRDYGLRTSGIDICERGLLVEKTKSDETGETDHLARAMALLLDDESLRERISRNSQAYMKEYSDEDICDQWLRVIEETPRNQRPLPLVSIPGLDRYKKVIVYGAGKYGQVAMRYLLDNRSDLDFLCFAVSTGHRQTDECMGVPVYEIGNLKEHREDGIVIISASETHEHQVKGVLDELGFRYVFMNF